MSEVQNSANENNKRRAQNQHIKRRRKKKLRISESENSNLCSSMGVGMGMERAAINRPSVSYLVLLRGLLMPTPPPVAAAAV
nr:hypothetical protein [Tanacetum cinerariifolium]